MPRILVRAPIRPTEDPEKVRKAVLGLFPGAPLRETAEGVEATPADLARLRELVRSHRIPDTARGQMLAGLSADGLRARFRLGKQAAAVGRAHFGPVGSPLGEIEVDVEGDAPGEVERLIYHVAPDTTVEPELAEVPFSMRPETNRP